MAGRTDAAYNVGGMFTNGNPGLGQPATIVDDRWLNDKQEEILRTVEAAGLTPDITKQSQLLCAIRYFVLTRNSGGYWKGAADVQTLSLANIVTLTPATPSGGTQYITPVITGVTGNALLTFDLPPGAIITRVHVYGYTGAADGTVDVRLFKVHLTDGAYSHLPPVVALTMSAGETEEDAAPGSLAAGTAEDGYQFVAYLALAAAVAIGNAKVYGVRLAVTYP